MTFIIYCDESSDKGARYGDFFGGCIINSKYQHEITTALEEKKKELNLNSEIKWTKVTENYLDKYITVIDLFFDYIRDGKIKVRIMFRSSKDKPVLYDEELVHDKYFKLYYQFIKHSFGLMTIPVECTPADIVLYFDVLPDKHGKSHEFKQFINNLPNTVDFANSNIRIDYRNIIEADSRQHVLLQCVDIVLGAMYFKLNQFDKIKKDGAHTRGKRTIAKEKLYKHINKRISEILPNFNIGVSTGFRSFDNPHWDSPYEHWLFESK